MTNRIPDWVTPVAWVFLALSVASVAFIAFDIYGRRNRRGRRGGVADELVWVTSALYLGPFALALYRRDRERVQTETGAESGVETGVGTGAGTGAAEALPGGSASAVAHLLGVPLVVASGLTIAGIDLWPMILVIAVIAMVLLFVYERARRPDTTQAGRTNQPRRGVWGASSQRRPTLAGAAMVALVTVLAFDIGMGGWMLLLHFNELMPPATDGAFWFLMQIGVLAGLLTGWPAVRWLRGRELAT